MGGCMTRRQINVSRHRERFAQNQQRKTSQVDVGVNNPENGYIRTETNAETEERKPIK